MPAKPIVAYKTTHGVVHRHCLHPFQKPHREAAKKAVRERRSCPEYPAMQTAWYPGHPSLPLQCAHCGKTIERGTEVA